MSNLRGLFPHNFLKIEMQPNKRKTQLLQKTTTKKWKNTLGIINNAKRFVFSAIVFGKDFSRSFGFCLLNNIIPPSESTFYKAQKEVVGVLLNLAQESANENLRELDNNAVLAMDGSWGTKYNLRTFILDFIDVSTKKKAGCFEKRK